MEKLKRGLSSDPEILGGAVVFVGTRVPAQALVDYLQGGHSLEDFLEDFPSVTQEHVASVMEEGK